MFFFQFLSLVAILQKFRNNHYIVSVTNFFIIYAQNSVLTNLYPTMEAMDLYMSMMDYNDKLIANSLGKGRC